MRRFEVKSNSCLHLNIYQICVCKEFIPTAPIYINVTIGKSCFIQQNGGFFVEVGGFDGEQTSNTLFLEQRLGWTGLLIEADPYYYTQLMGKSRRSWSINACISPHQYPTMVSLTDYKLHPWNAYLQTIAKGVLIWLKYILIFIYNSRNEIYYSYWSGVKSIMKTIVCMTLRVWMIYNVMIRRKITIQIIKIMPFSRPFLTYGWMNFAKVPKLMLTFSISEWKIKNGISTRVWWKYWTWNSSSQIRDGSHTKGTCVT